MKKVLQIVMMKCWSINGESVTKNVWVKGRERGVHCKALAARGVGADGGSCCCMNGTLDKQKH